MGERAYAIDFRPPYVKIYEAINEEHTAAQTLQFLRALLPLWGTCYESRATIRRKGYLAFVPRRVSFHLTFLFGSRAALDCIVPIRSIFHLDIDVLKGMEREAPWAMSVATASNGFQQRVPTFPAMEALRAKQWQHILCVSRFIVPAYIFQKGHEPILAALKQIPGLKEVYVDIRELEPYYAQISRVRRFFPGSFTTLSSTPFQYDPMSTIKDQWALRALIQDGQKSKLPLTTGLEVLESWYYESLEGFMKIWHPDFAARGIKGMLVARRDGDN
ncbi:hypothetical protein BJ170DRAFT_331593 [Xylariales sp. AK1849]|nr:hypothetical protein BJ170DRAFT_331593 [Xylariales sp. AK1849]